MASDHGGRNELETYAQSRVGKTLRGKYRLDAVIGLGGMAVVYKATHRNQAEFAVKMLHPELSLRDDVKARFVREGYAANSVKHPGVVLVVDDDVAEDGAAFIVMELIDGVGAEVLWERSHGRMPVLPVCSIGHQLLDVLASAHAKGIVHRDLKPANLFVTRDGKVKVLDFGIARVRDVAASSATMTGMLLGTPAFMGPEQALAKTSEIDAQTDIWAVGATLFTMLSGALVHEADNAQQILIKAATQKAQSLAVLAPHVPRGIVAVVDRALAFDKVDRWLTAVQMRDAIDLACRAAFDRAPSSASILALVQTPDAAAHARTEVAPAAFAHTEVLSPVGSTTAHSPKADTPNQVPSPPAHVTVAVVPPDVSSPSGGSPAVSARQLMGVSTANPVASERIALPIAGRGSAKWFAGALAAAALASGSVLVLRRSVSDPRVASTDASSILASAVAQPPDPPPAVVSADPSAPVAAAEAGASTAATSADTPSIKPAASPHVGVAVNRSPIVSAQAHAATTTMTVVSARPPPAPAASNCHRVSAIGPDGETHFKKVCE